MVAAIMALSTFLYHFSQTVPWPFFGARTPYVGWLPCTTPFTCNRHFS
jgi:hypothetical protein